MLVDVHNFKPAVDVCVGGDRERDNQFEIFPTAST
jgi:hypothetical protein